METDLLDPQQPKDGHEHTSHDEVDESAGGSQGKGLENLLIE